MKIPSICILLCSVSTLVSGFTTSFGISRKSSSVILSKHDRQARGVLKTSKADADENLPDPLPTIPPVPHNCKRLLLVRHGEVIPPGGKHGVLYGSMDVPLSDLGKKEAVAAAEFLHEINLHQICSSPLSRALYGANQIMSMQEKLFKKETMFKKILVDSGFTELSRGEWTGMTREEIGEDKMTRFNECDPTVTPIGGESYPTVMKRVLAARDALLQATDAGRASCLVSHLQVTRCILR